MTVSTDEGLKSAGYMTEAILNKFFAKTDEPNETALNIAFKTDLPAFEWYETPGNEYRLLRFNITMDASRRFVPSEATTDGS